MIFSPPDSGHSRLDLWRRTGGLLYDSIASAPPLPPNPGGFDDDAWNYIARANITNAAHRTAIDTFTKGLKTNSLWAKLDVIYPFVGGTAVAHAQNLKGSTNTITWNGTVFHDMQGMRGDGTTGYGDTGLSVSSQDLNNFSMQAYLQFASTGLGTIIGASNGGVTLYQLAASNAITYADVNNTNSPGRLSTGGSLPPGGVFIAQRVTNILGQIIIRGGVQNSTAGAATVTSFSRNFFIGALNNSGVPSQFHPYPIKYIAIGRSMVGADVANIHTLVNNLQTALGRPDDADAKSFLTSTGITDGALVSAVNKLVYSLKPLTAWNQCHCLFPFVGGTALAHSMNLKGVYQPILWTGTITHNALGSAGDGVSGSGTIQLNPAGVLSMTHCTMGAYVTEAGSSAIKPLVGCQDTSLNTDCWLKLATTPTVDFEAGAVSGRGVPIAVPSLLGMFSGTRGGGTDKRTYRNGAIVSPNGPTGVAPLTNLQLAILSNRTQAGTNEFSNHRLGFVYVGNNITTADHLALYNAVQAFQTELGRAV